MIAHLAALLLATSPAPASPCAPRGAPSDETRERVCAYLGTIDVPIGDDGWRALGPEADAVLEEVARSTDLGFRRARALGGLASRAAGQAASERSPVAERVHRELLASADAPVEVRRGAVRGLARLLSAAELTAALGPLSERDGDGRVRAAASEALARRAPASACPGIRARAAAGGAETLRLERALAACAQADR